MSRPSFSTGSHLTNVMFAGTPDTLSFNHTGLGEKRYYWYSLFVLDTVGNVSDSVTAFAQTPDQTPPDAEINLTAEWIGGTLVRLTGGTVAAIAE